MAVDAAIGELHPRTARPLFQLCLRIACDAAEAEDAVHETFDDLQQGALVKVEFSSRTGSSVTAREIDVSSRDGQPQFPESEGLVSAVDTTNNTITVVRRNNDPLLVGGQSLTSVTLHVTANTFLFRKDRSGGGRGVITLSQVVPGSDRIWFRGTVTGPGQVDADWVRVRTN